MPRKKKQDHPQEPEPTTNEMQNVDVDELKEIAGGQAYKEWLIHAKVKCPRPGCDFECDTFTEMNVHMREVHGVRHKPYF